jgi:hypothetical protein
MVSPCMLLLCLLRLKSVGACRLGLRLRLGGDRQRRLHNALELRLHDAFELRLYDGLELYPQLGRAR